MNIEEINKIREENRLLNEQEFKTNKTILKSKPQNILVILNNTCNLKCIMCKDFLPSKYIISDSLFYDIIDNMKFFESFSCQGGEPLLFDKFNIILDKAKEFHTHLNITTNGSLLDEDFIKRLYDMSVIIHISIDGFDKQTYESIRIGASFDTLKENLKILKYYKQQKGFEQLRYELFMVPQKLNYTRICDAIDFANLYGFSGIRFIQIRGRGFEDFLLNDIETSFTKVQLLKCIERVHTEHINLLIDTDIPLDYKKTHNLQNYLTKDFKDICLIPWKTISIQKFQKISLDCLCDFTKSNPVNSLEEAWNNQYIQDIRKGLIENNPISSCINCYRRKLFNDIKG